MKTQLNNVKLQILNFVVITAAPFTAPSNITLTTKSSTSLTYEFNEIPCEYRNGVIIGYTCVIDMIEDPGVFVNEQSVFVNETRVTFVALLPGRRYSVQIAANSSVGVVGPFSKVKKDATDSGE